MVKTSLSNAGGVGSIPTPGAKIPTCLKEPKHNSITTNSIETLKTVHIKRNKKVYSIPNRKEADSQNTKNKAVIISGKGRTERQHRVWELRGEDYYV